MNPALPCTTASHLHAMQQGLRLHDMADDRNGTGEMANEAAKTGVLKRQRDWAERAGKRVDSQGYLDTVHANLYRPLSALAESHFGGGSGSELLDTPARPAKMKALHSSAALAVNIFDYWTARDATPLVRALGFPAAERERSTGAIGFERQFPTGLAGNPPNLDVTISLSSGITLAVESKFTEWMTPKPARSDAFRPAYFPGGSPLWSSRGLPRCQRLAEAIAAGQEHFRWLDAPQLLKHALGLATAEPSRFSLYFLYFDGTGPYGTAHRDEVARFSSLVGEETGFVSRSYQALFDRLGSHTGEDDRDYLAYLGNRYF